MMIVDKERLFLENIGAVHQLSKISGDLGDRIDDLEKANESVAVSSIAVCNYIYYYFLSTLLIL